jgi:outer membrane protein OmpA-like peptidoglycan-associated protein
MMATKLMNSASGSPIGRLHLAGWAAALLLVLSACTTTPERIAELDEARATVEALQSQPKARQAASVQLTSAQEALQRADAALENGEPVELVRHEAYLARRHAEIGLEMTSEAEAEEEMSQAEARRNEVQLQARTVEAERARRLAEQRGEQVEASQSAAEAARAEAERLADELNLLEGELEAQQTERGLVLTLGDVLFDTARSELKEGAQVSMDRLAEFLRENPERRLLVEGHTDARGSEEFNRDLSARRADAVSSALAQRGIPRDRLRSVGLGEAYPVASNETPAGMQQNRRVEIVVSNPDGTFPASAEQRIASSDYE